MDTSKPCLVSSNAQINGRENRPLVTGEPLEVQDFMKTTDHLEEYIQNIPQLNKENPKDCQTCNQLDLETLGFWPMMPKISPDTALSVKACTSVASVI